jgi:dienelactone hydrolase
MKHSFAVPLILLILACATACSTAPVLSDADIRSAYKAGSGPLSVKIEQRTQLSFPALEKDLRMRVAFPEAPGNYPLIIFSHGNGCLQDLYTGFADHWASWGYVVIQPVHMDSRELGFSMKGATLDKMNKVVSSRLADVRFVLDSLDQLEAQVPGLIGQIDRDKLIMAGHSMGAGTAMMLNGVEMLDLRSDGIIASDEDRFDALIIISEPSNNRMMPNDPWRMAKVPTFIATGSEDFSMAGARDGRKSRNAYQLPADAEFPDQPHYYLYMDGMDHYLGGLICREDKSGPRDHSALEIINGSSVAFLHAFIEGDPAAQGFLDSGEITGLTEGRATLELR